MYFLWDIVVLYFWENSGYILVFDHSLPMEYEQHSWWKMIHDAYKLYIGHMRCYRSPVTLHGNGGLVVPALLCFH